MISEKILFSKKENVYMDAYLRTPSDEMPDRKIRPAVIVCPGGGYEWCSAREADPVAMQFLAAGYNVFVLYYSIHDKAVFPEPLIDLSQAVKEVRTNAEKYGIDPNRIAVIGFSAGGHLTASLGTLWNNKEIQAAAGVSGEENKPNAILLGYPVITVDGWIKESGSLDRLVGESDREKVISLLDCHKNVGKQTPPAFLVHAADDGTVPVGDSLKFAGACDKAGVPFELHIFPNMGHGFSLANRETSGEGDVRVASWVNYATSWLNRIFNW
jgi:acetyl esterase/lipase